jgi:hypothetical protein
VADCRSAYEGSNPSPPSKKNLKLNTILKLFISRE